MNIPEKLTCIIPVRFGSSRFPGKPLAEINGKAMLTHVWDNANKAEMLDEVIVAAYDQETEDFCKKEGMRCIRTSPSVKNGGEAVADVAKSIDAPYIFELQGDQPLVGPDVIDNFLKKGREHIIKNPSIDIVQPFAEADEEETNSVDVVKVAISKSHKMLLISREPIKSGYRTLGLYIWRKPTLLDFPKMLVTEYEKAETCHLLRFFLNDLYVQGILLDGKDWVEVDQPEHIKQVEALLSKNE
jgi:3-deoxy-manno-octulosonate cytidylyltransferase (CMP-KDO synthetase)